MSKKSHFKYQGPVEGFHTVVNEKNSKLKFLKFGRLYLNNLVKADIANGSNETILCVESGSASVFLDGTVYTLCKLDTLYIPSSSKYTVEKVSSTPLSALIFDAPSINKNKPALVKYDELEVQTSGKGSCEREVRLAFGTDKTADRLILGFCFGNEGGWTGWPPHEHSDNLEELYLYIDLPSPGFLLQYYYQTLDDMEFFKVNEGDAFAISKGYHPIVAAPGYRMKNIWVMSAKEAVKDRKLDISKLQPEYI